MSPPNLHNANILASFQTLTFSNVPEHVEPTWLPVDQGELPSWLNGTMYRVGGGRFNLGDGSQRNEKTDLSGATYTVRHAFDGLPFLYRFEFNGKNNTLRFNSRYIAKDLEKNILARKGKGAIWFGESREMSTWERIKDIASRFDQLVLRPKPPTPSSMSIGITTTPNYPLPLSWEPSGHMALVTKSDHNALQQLDHDTLEPQKIYSYRDYNKQLNGQLAAAHHQFDYDTKETINMTMTVGPKPTLQVFSIDSTGTTKILATITHGLDERKTPVRSFYYHSFYMTKNYVVIPVSPLYYRNSGLDFLLNGSVLSGLEWEPDTPTYFHIIDRHHGKGHVATLLGPSYFAFHIVNGVDSQDDSGNIVFELDCAAYDGKMIYESHAFGNIIRASDYDKYVAAAEKNKGMVKTHNGIAYPPSHCNAFGDYRRYTLIWDPATTTNGNLASFETLCTNFDFPRINTAYTFKKHRYVYGCQVQNPTKERGERYALVKVDVLQQKVIRYEHQDNNGYACSEPIFVPKPPPLEEDDDHLEDDGVVLSFVNVFDNRESQYDYCYLLVLDASTFDQVARIHIGQYTAPTFHGSYADDYYYESGSFN